MAVIAEVTAVNNIVQVTTVERVTGGVTVVAGNNMVQNAVVSPTAPTNPFEGQIWIDIS